TVDLTGDHLGFTPPASLQSIVANKNAYSLKTIASEGNYDRSADLNVLRADGHYKFDHWRARLDFGVRYGDRKADNANFVLIAPVYGCDVRYKAVDVILDGGGMPGACMAGSAATGFYRAGRLSALNPSQLSGLFG